MTLPISAAPSAFDLSNTIIPIKNKVYEVGRRVFYHLSRHQYALSVAVWTSLAIQVGVNASSIFTVDAIDDLETCEEKFHAYLNISHPNSISSGVCCPKGTELNPFSSLGECMFYLKTVHSWYIKTRWNTICPSTNIVRRAERLNQVIARCFNRLCSENDAIYLVNKAMSEWCSLQEAEKAKETLKSLTKNSILPESDEWTMEDMLQVSVDLFLEMIKKAEAVLASTLSKEIVEYKMFHPQLNLLKRGTKKLVSLSITIIKSLLEDDLAKELATTVQQSLLEIVEKIEESLPLDNSII